MTSNGSMRVTTADFIQMVLKDRVARPVEDLDDDTLRLFFAVFAAWAEFGRELIRERTKAGMDAERRRGKKVGRPVVLTPEKLDLARRLVAEGKGRAIVVRMIGVGPATLRHGLNAP
jgi:DNA invertase Pin-like site-specific DNA recombinase